MEGDQKVDGNAIAGVLGEIFAVEVTQTVGTCGACGNSGRMAELAVYLTDHGAVLRCLACGEVLIKVVQGRDRTWVDLAGIRRLEIAAG